MAMKQQIIFRLLHEQHITPEEAEVLMQEPEWKYNPGTWTVPSDQINIPSQWEAESHSDIEVEMTCTSCSVDGVCQCGLGGKKSIFGPIDAQGMYAYSFDQGTNSWIANT